MNDLYTTIGHNIKTRRIALGLTQQDLASAIDTKRTSITNLEAGRQCIPLDKLYILCEFLEVGIYDVIPPLVPAAKTEVLTIEGIEVEVSPKVAAMIRSVI